MKYASGFAPPAALPDDLFDQPAGYQDIVPSHYSCFNFFLISSAPYRPDSSIEPKAGPILGVPNTAATANPMTKQFGYTSPVRSMISASDRATHMAPFHGTALYRFRL